MRNGTTDLGTLVTRKGGLDAGGYVTSVRVADDLTIYARTDCAGIAIVRSPGDTEGRQLFRWGENIPLSEYASKIVAGSPTGWIYDVAPCASNSSIAYAAFLGFVWKTTDKALSWTKTNWNGGVRDQDLTWAPFEPAKVGGQHIKVHPTNGNVVVVGHPITGAKYSTDGGATWTACNGVPLPLNVGSERRGICIDFDRSTNEWVIVVEGRGTYKASSITGAFALVGTGSPTTASSLCAAGGRIYACGNSSMQDSQLFVWNGSAWSQPAGVTGISVDARPADVTEVLVMTIGGGMHHSTNSGATWTPYLDNVPFKTDGAECPYLAKVNSDYMALGEFRWAPGATRKLIASSGVGLFEQTTIPRTSSTQLWNDKSLGIQQKLVMALVTTPTGKLLAACQDKPLYIYDRANVTKQPTINHPDAVVPIRHAVDVDYARNDENYIVLPYLPAQNLSLDATRTIQITANGGTSWAPPANVPRDGNNNKLYCGCIAVGNTGNIVWAAINGIAGTEDGGATAWFTPNFRTSVGGTPIDVSTARWYRARDTRRKMLWADKTQAGVFYCMLSNMFDGNGTEVGHPEAGLYKSTDGGRNFIRIWAGMAFSVGGDAYAMKLRDLSKAGYATHLFAARGNQNAFGDPPADGGFWFSTDAGITKQQIPNVAEVEDVAFGRGKAGSSYPRILFKGFLNGQQGLWYSDNFNPTNAAAATWQLWTQFPMGRADDDVVLVGDMTRVGRFYVATPAGGFQVLERDFTLRVS